MESIAWKQKQCRLAQFMWRRISVYTYLDSLMIRTYFLHRCFGESGQPKHSNVMPTSCPLRLLHMTCHVMSCIIPYDYVPVVESVRLFFHTATSAGAGSTFVGRIRRPNRQVVARSYFSTQRSTIYIFSHHVSVSAPPSHP